MVNAISKKGKKEAKAMLQKIKGTVKCVDDPDKRGKHIGQSRWLQAVNKKDRRHDGRVEAKYVNPTMKFKTAHAEGIDPVEYYEEWITMRDCFRSAHESERLQVPEKVKKEQEIRKAMKKIKKYEGVIWDNGI